jgi:hypothetical protein
MRFISTRVHGILDYLVGALLVISPWLFNFDNGGAETWVPVIVGIVILIQALMTNYELGVFKTLSMRTHLTMDFIIGLFLAASPWIFNFNDYIWEPHVLFGVMSIVASHMTRTAPDQVHSRHTVSNPSNPFDNRL